LRTKEQGTHLTLNEHDDDDDEKKIGAVEGTASEYRRILKETNEKNLDYRVSLERKLE